MYSDPMPGEDYESAEARERARREREAIANGESFNPYSDDGFENLGDDVPFAGDAEAPETATIGEAAAELLIEDDPAVVAATVAADEGLSLVGDIMEDGFEREEPQTPSEMAAEISKKHDSDNAISAKFNEQWDQGKVPNPDDIKDGVQRDYPEDAIEQSATNPDATADLANTDRNLNERPDAESEPVSDQPHDIAEKTTIEAVSASALADKVAEGIERGDQDAIARASEVKQRAEEAIASANKISTATLENSEDNLETRMATDVAAEATDMALDAIEKVEDAEADYNSMTEEEKEETKAAAEAAEINGTTVEEEKTKAEEEKKDNGEEDDWTPDLSRGIFG